MKNLSIYILCLLVLVLPGCGMLTPQQRDAGTASLDSALVSGQITQAQHDAAIEALNKKTIDWNEILLTGGSVIGSILLGVPISVGAVNRMRGPNEAQRQAAKTANKPA